MQLGIGISTFTEMCGLAPSRVLGQLDYGAGGWEHASVRMLATGKVEVVTGASAHGQGHETAFSQIVADRLGVAFEDVEVLHGDTQVAHKGLDTYGSRSLVVGGEALVKAADKVIEKAKPIAAHLLEASVDDLEFSGGRFTVRGTDQGMAIGEIATAVFAAHNLPDGVEPSIDAEATYDPVNFNYPHGTHLCAMEVDTETGAVKMRKYVCVDDIGNIVNPLIVAGQVHGGLVQGIAQALWEEAVYDDSGTLVSGLVRRLPAADRGRHDQLRDRAHDDAGADQHARHQGRRRGRHHRLDAGRGQRGRRRRTPPRGQRHPDAVHARAGVEGDQRTRLRRRDGGCGDAALRVRWSGRQPGATRHVEHGRSGRMIPAAFDYVAPTTVEDALAALAEYGDEAKIIAGGQSLLPVLRMRLNAPEWIIDLGKIESLRGIRDDGDAIVIGAMTPHVVVGSDPLVAEHAALITKAVEHLADAQVRHRGTFGGALAHADPAGDLGAPALALGAEFVIAGSGRHPHRRGRRLLRRPLRDRDRRGRDPHRGADPEAHRLGRALREVRAGRPPVADRGGRRDRPGRGRHHRRGPDRADQHGQHARCGPGPVEDALAGQPATDDAVRAAAALAAEGTNPPSDLNGDADYRRHLATVLTRRAVLAAAGRA